MPQVPNSVLLDMIPANKGMLSGMRGGSSVLVSRQRQTASEEKTVRESENERGNLPRGKVIRARSLILPLVLHMSRNLEAVHNSRGHLKLAAQELSEGSVAGTVGAGEVGANPASLARLRESRRVNFSALDSEAGAGGLSPCSASPRRTRRPTFPLSPCGSTTMLESEGSPETWDVNQSRRR